MHIKTSDVRRLREIDLFFLEDLVRRILLLPLLRDLVHLDSKFLDGTSQFIDSGVHPRLPSHQLLHRLLFASSDNLRALRASRSAARSATLSVCISFTRSAKFLTDCSTPIRNTLLFPRLVLRTQKIIKNCCQDLSSNYQMSWCQFSLTNSRGLLQDLVQSSCSSPPPDAAGSDSDV